jgi:tetrahydromethanopterin S-methyltransferase subunit B
VFLNQKIAATFSNSMDPATISTSSFTLMQGTTPISGTVTYVGLVATFDPDVNLAVNTLYTATITTGATDLEGNPLAADYVWSFTTGAVADTTRPTVVLVNPANLATGVFLNQKIAATFSEAMDPATISTSSFTLMQGATPISGTVTYVGLVATFDPDVNLAANTLYTATITTGATDLAGNALAANYVWSFTTGAAADTTPPTVILVNPANLATGVFLNQKINATFSKLMDPLTITTANYKLAGPGTNPVTGTVTYDLITKIATFKPSSNLTANTDYTVTITTGVKDLAGNAMANNYVWTFRTGTTLAQAPINLGAAGAFAIMARSSTSSTGVTLINGDVGVNPGSAQGIPPSQVNGTIHVQDAAIIEAQASLLAAYNDAISRSIGSQTLPGNIGGLTFTPGLYTNSTSVLISGGNVTLDAQGDSSAVFIFKMGSTLTTGPGAQVILSGGAKANNVYWQVGSSATLDTTTIFKGNILAAITITANTGTVVEGRLLAGSTTDGSVTLNATTVTLPLP